MTQRPQLKLVVPETEDRNPRALNRLDWIALWLLAVALIIAPIWAGTFATPDRISLILTESPLSILDNVGFSLILALAAVAFGILAWREIKRPVAIGAIPGLAAGMALMGLWALFSLVRSHALYFSLNALAALFAAMMIGGLMARLGRDRRGFAVFLLTIILGGGIVSALGDREYLYWVGQHINNHRAFATFVNPDFLAGYLLVVLPLTLAAFAAANSQLLQLVLGICLALQSACLLLTGSRAGAAMLIVALIFWGILAVASGAAKKRGKSIGIGIAIVLIFAGLASGPTWLRIAAPAAPPPSNPGAASTPAPPSLPSVADQQGYSGNFRKYTWMGTVQMARSNPLLGTGIGTYEIAYPRYSETAFTAHAHNSYLQWMAETGMPGLLFLLVGFAAATAFASSILILRRGETEETETAPASSEPGASSLLQFDAPRLILAGLLASVFATLMHSLTDSDWYIVATLVTLGGVLGLLSAQSRDIAPLAVQLPRPQARGILIVGGCAALFLLWRAVGVGGARYDEALETAAIENRQIEAAIAASRSAASADPFDPEPQMDLALLYGATQRPELALPALQQAVRIAPTGKPLYRLGQFYIRSGDLPHAIEAFKRARSAEPHNVQNLKVLADTLRSAGNTQEAREVYKDLTALERSPYGKVRAVPEMVETDFAYAHAGLAEMAADAQNWSEAATESAAAAAVLREFWSFFQKDFEVRQRTPPERQEKLVTLYDHMLTMEADALKRLGRAADAARATAELTQFHTWRDADLKAHPPANPDTGGSANS